MKRKPQQAEKKAVHEAQTLNAEETQDSSSAVSSLRVAAPGGSVTLSKRQIEVLRLVAAGLTNQQIADKLGLSIHTIETHLHVTYRKLKITTRGAAVRYAIEHKVG